MHRNMPTTVPASRSSSADVDRRAHLVRKARQHPRGLSILKRSLLLRQGIEFRDKGIRGA
jgi:hypothetical protein